MHHAQLSITMEKLQAMLQVKEKHSWARETSVRLSYEKFVKLLYRKFKIKKKINILESLMEKVGNTKEQMADVSKEKEILKE